MSETAPATRRSAIPRDEVNDYTAKNAAIRREFIRERTGADLSHVAKYSFDPAILQGNIENFIGVAQVPIGVAEWLVERCARALGGQSHGD